MRLWWMWHDDGCGNQIVFNNTCFDGMQWETMSKDHWCVKCVSSHKFVWVPSLTSVAFNSPVASWPLLLECIYIYMHVCIIAYFLKATLTSTAVSITFSPCCWCTVPYLQCSLGLHAKKASSRSWERSNCVPWVHYLCFTSCMLDMYSTSWLWW